MKRTGELLKKAREERGLSLHEVALFLKINSRVLQALEEGDQAQLPARTFLRGFVQSYAKFLKLDSQMVLQIFNEETAPVNAPPAPAVAREKEPEVVVNHLPDEKEEVKEVKSDADAVNLEKSILTKSQVAQDKLNSKTIAISIMGLLVVIVLYFANNIIKKYQREAEVDPRATIAITDNTEPVTEPAEGSVSSTVTVSPPTVLPENPTAANPTPSPVPTPAPTLTPSTQPAPAATANAEVKQNNATSTPVTPSAPTSEKPVLSSVMAPTSASSAPSLHPAPSVSPIIGALTLTTPGIVTKPKLPEQNEEKPAVQKPTTPVIGTPVAAPVPISKPTTTPGPTAIAPAAAPAPVAPQAAKPVAPTPSPVSTTPAAPTAPASPAILEGKLVEVIVEANDSVEIEYSSAKTSPQRMVLKAEQIHTFKSRSGVRLKISNGGAVNIIMNGRDLGAPGAAGQPIQVAY